MTIQYIDDDFVRVRREPASRGKARVTLAFGDAVEVLGSSDDGKFTRVRVHGYYDGPFEGWIKGDPPLRDEGVLKFSMVDVQQGDGLVLETPGGKIVLIDGGDNKLFARHLAQRFKHRQATAQDPLEVDAIIITHGDADHFDGLNDIRRSETLTGDRVRKRLFIHPRRVFHNGLVKRPGSVPEKGRLGPTVEHNGRLYATQLVDDPATVSADERNQPFDRWVSTLEHWRQRGPIDLRRLAVGMDEAELFDFLHEENLQVELQGPFSEEVERDGAQVPALRFFSKPKKTAELHLEQGDDRAGSPSVAHTINGHSVALRFTYGNVRLNLTGDLNREAMDLMFEQLDPTQLEAEVVKAPHHGSSDFDFKSLQAMRPVVTIISSGDESAAKEHIHPRATLMAAIGKCMRQDTGVVFCTELAAFFKTKKECHTRQDLANFFKERKDQTFTGEELRQLFTGEPKRGIDPPGLFFGFERSNFGIVHLRTDGERVLVFTHSGKAGLNEAYRFHVDADHQVTFAPRVVTR